MSAARKASRSDLPGMLAAIVRLDVQDEIDIILTSRGENCDRIEEPRPLLYGQKLRELFTTRVVQDLVDKAEISGLEIPPAIRQNLMEAVHDMVDEALAENKKIRIIPIP